MGTKIKKGPSMPVETAPHLSITDRIADLLIDMEASWRGPSRGQQALLAQLTAEAHRLAAIGQVQLVSRVSRIWDNAPAKLSEPWYERDQRLFPLPDVTPRAYRMGGSRIC